MTSEPSLWEDGPRPVSVEPPGEAAIARPESEELRWRSQTVTAPIEILARAGAHAGEAEGRYAERYDLRRLAHRAIDAVVASMGFGHELTDEQLIAGIASAAARMAPLADQAEWQQVGEFVYGHLMNAPDDFAKFNFTAVSDDGRRRPWEFSLLVPRVSETGVAITASPEAINVFLKAFELDVTDAEVAMSVMLTRQISEGRFDAAGQTAEAAGRVSLAAAAKISELLEDTRRDVGSVDWRGSMRSEIERLRRHVGSRVKEDDHLLDHVHAGTENEDALIRAKSGEIAETLTWCKKLHLSLEARLVRAHRTFLDAQTEQRLAHRRRLRLLAIGDQLLTPVLSLPAADAALVTDAFAGAALGTVVPRIPHLPSLIDQLLAPGRATEPAEREAEDPDVSEEPELDAYSEDAMREARAILGRAAVAPRRLSELLADARSHASDEVTDLVWLGALWAYAPDVAASEDPDASTPDELAGGLAGEDDGTALEDEEFGGADLLVGTARALEPAPPLPAVAPPEPINLAEYRSHR